MDNSVYSLFAGNTKHILFRCYICHHMFICQFQTDSIRISVNSHHIHTHLPSLLYDRDLKYTGSQH